MSILEQMAEQFEEDIKDTKLNTDKIPEEQILNDNESTIRKNEKNKVFITGEASGKSKDINKEFFNESNRPVIDVEIVDDDKKKSEKSSSRTDPYSRPRTSPYSTYTTSSSKTTQEIEKERERERISKLRKETDSFTRSVLASCLAEALTETKVVSKTRTDWDIFELQRMAVRSKTPKGIEDINKAKRKIRRYKGICSFVADIIGATYFTHRKEELKDNDWYNY